MSWQDYDAPEEHVATQGYPFIQWWNGKPELAQLHPVLGSGGWMLPTDQVGQLEKAEAVVVPHRNGDSTEAYLAAALSLSVLATRFAWFVERDGRRVYLDEYQDGARGKLNVLTLVKGVSEAEPVMVTLSGYASKEFSATLRQFRNEVLGAARAATRKSYPDYTFWMRVRAGEIRQVGSGNARSPVTPPAPAWPSEALKNPDRRVAALTEMFVGDTVLAAAQELWSTAQAWAKRRYQQRDNGQGNGDTPMPEGPPDDWHDGYEPPPLYGEELPF